MGVAEVFGGVAASVDLEGDAAALEGCANSVDALAMRMVQAFGDTQDGGEAAGYAFVVVVEGGIGGMVAGWFGFAVVIADERAHHAAVAAFEARYVAIQREVFSMLVVAAMTDAMAYIMQERAGFELDARLRRQVMHGLKLVKKHQA